MMGLYLSHLATGKRRPATGRIPDENFAREVMQLFSIGVDELNADGTPQRDGAGDAIDDLRQRRRHRPREGLHRLELVRAAARRRPLLRRSRRTRSAFADAADPERDIRPMRSYRAAPLGEREALPRHRRSPAEHRAPRPASGSPSTGCSQHPNVGPFIGRQLIQRLVTSNPSPAYVGRVAAAFADNGAGVRGDMKAVRARVLLDPEARADPAPRRPAFGKLREPLLRITAWMRAFNVRSTFGRLGVLLHRRSGRPRSARSPLQSPSVFNFFRPGYVPPQSEAGRAGLAVPEMQIASETTVGELPQRRRVDDRLLRHRLPARPLHRLQRRSCARRRPGGAGRPGRPAALRRRDEQCHEVADAPGGRVGARAASSYRREPRPARACCSRWRPPNSWCRR